MTGIHAGRLYVIDTSAGRKLVRVTQVEGGHARIAKLRATSLRWTRPVRYALEVLDELNIREPASTDNDLIRAADKADAKVKAAARVARRLAVRA